MRYAITAANFYVLYYILIRLNIKCFPHVRFQSGLRHIFVSGNALLFREIVKLKTCVTYMPCAALPYVIAHNNVCMYVCNRRLFTPWQFALLILI